MKKVWLFLACILYSALALFAQNTSDFQKKSLAVSPVLTVVNDTGYTFYYLYISPAESDSWGKDVLGDQVLYDGQSFRYALPYNGIWDILAKDRDEDTYTRRLMITADTTLALTLDDLESLSVSPMLTVVNDTGYTFYYLYVSPSDSDSWGKDVLEGQVLYDGQSFRYALPYNGTWDILAEDSDEDTYTRRLMITADTTLALTFDDLD
jgi:hypothetical protein